MDNWLSPREEEVWSYYMEGYSYKEIAEKVGIKVSTVSTYLDRARHKMRKSELTIDRMSKE